MTSNFSALKQFVFLVLTVSPIYTNTLFGQALKTYNGSYDNGKATYTYYEDNEFNRIFQGDFTYTGRLYNAKGQFEKGKENGKWTIWATNKVHQNPGAKFQINTIINGSFINGSFDGLWSYSNSMRLWFTLSNKYDTNDDKEISTANFKNNKFVGKISYTSNWPNVMKVEGQFANSGMLDGTWLMENKTNKHIIKYLNGVVCWRLSQVKSTGEKLVFFDSTAFVNKFWQNYDTLTNTSIVNGKKYYPKKMQLFRTHSIDGVINSGYSRYKELENPAIELWTSESVSLYENQALTNPLYCYKIDSKQLPTNPPYCYEVIIEEK